MKFHALVAAAFALALPFATPVSARQAPDPQRQFDHDVRCTLAGMAVVLKTQNQSDYRSILALKVYAHRMKADGKALGLTPQEIGARTTQAMQKEMAPFQGANDGAAAALMQMMETDFAACQKDLIGPITPMAASVSPPMLALAYDGDMACLYVYTRLPENDDRAEALVLGGAPAYLTRFKGEADAMHKAEDQRIADLGQVANRVNTELNATFKPGVMSADDIRRMNDLVFTRAQACTDGLKG